MARKVERVLRAVRLLLIVLRAFVRAGSPVRLPDEANPLDLLLRLLHVLRQIVRNVLRHCTASLRHVLCQIAHFTGHVLGKTAKADIAVFPSDGPQARLRQRRFRQRLYIPRMLEEAARERRDERRRPFMPFPARPRQCAGERRVLACGRRVRRARPDPLGQSAFRQRLYILLSEARSAPLRQRAQLAQI